MFGSKAYLYLDSDQESDSDDEDDDVEETKKLTRDFWGLTLVPSANGRFDSDLVSSSSDDDGDEFDEMDSNFEEGDFSRVVTDIIENDEARFARK